MKKLLTVAAIAEAATGLALMVVPSLVGRLLLGAELIGVAIPVARVTRHRPDRIRGRLLAGSASAVRHVDLRRGCDALFLISRHSRQMGRATLWPAVVLHAVLTLLLARAWFTESHNQYSKKK